MDWKVYRRAALVACIPALLAAYWFKPSSGTISSFMFLVTYIPQRLLIYWPHELGHVVAGWLGLGRVPLVFAGTGVQVFLPLGVVLFCLKRREYLFAMIAVLWLGYALRDAAYYMADAASPKFVLVRPFDPGTYKPGDEGHDWIFLFKHFGMMTKAVGLARAVYAIGIWCLCFPPAQLLFSGGSNKDE